MFYSFERECKLIHRQGLVTDAIIPNIQHVMQHTRSGSAHREHQRGRFHYRQKRIGSCCIQWKGHIGLQHSGSRSECDCNSRILQNGILRFGDRGGKHR